MLIDYLSDLEVKTLKINTQQLNSSVLADFTDDELFDISKTLHLNVDEIKFLIQIPKRMEFDIFKSETCHRLKTYGDIKFINIIENKKIIEKYWKFKWYAESLYVLAMIEELYCENNLEISNKYEFYQNQKLKTILFPKSAYMEMCLFNNEKDKIEKIYLKNANKYFLKYNIVEGNIRDIV